MKIFFNHKSLNAYFVLYHYLMSLTYKDLLN